MCVCGGGEEGGVKGRRGQPDIFIMRVHNVLRAVLESGYVKYTYQRLCSVPCVLVPEVGT